MKKQLIAVVALSAVAVLASCTKEQNSEPKGMEIGFNAVAHKNLSTKANGDTDNQLVWGSAFPLENTFNVWGFQSAIGDFSEFTASSASNFMSGIKIEWTGGRDSRTEAWRNAERYYYWPYTGKIGFYAIAPSSVAPTTATYGEFAIADYTIAAANQTTDLMYGYAEGASRTTALPLTFNHALSQIVYKIKTSEDYTADGAKFEVNKVELKGIDLSGDFSFSKPSTAAWSDNAALTEDYVYSDETAEATATEAIYDEAIVMIPQTWSATATKMEVTYTLTQANSAAQQGTVVVALPASTDGTVWKMGKRYIYTLNFNLREITFSPEVVDWVNVVVDEVVLP